MRTSPLTITYKSLQALAEEILKESETRYAGAQRNGTTNLDPLKARVENARVLVRMLEKCKPGKQADMFELFKEASK